MKHAIRPVVARLVPAATAATAAGLVGGYSVAGTARAHEGTRANTPGEGSRPGGG